MRLELHGPAYPSGERSLSMSSSHAGGSPHSSVLEVELLEGRCLLSTASYVSALYSNLLQRAGAPAEVAGWTAAINSGISPLQIAAAFINSPEFKTDLIVSDYQNLLGRQPSPAEIAGWFGQLQAGQGEFQVEAAFLGSGEFFAKQGNNVTTWLTAVYQNVLNRPVDPTGLAAWSQQLAAGGSRQDVALSIVNSGEALGRFVTVAYQDILKRNPSPDEVAAWVAALEAGLTPTQLLALISASPEFTAAQGGLDPIAPLPIVNPGPVDNFHHHMHPRGFNGGVGATGTGFTGGGFTGGFVGGFTGGGFTGGGFSGGGFSGGGSGGGSGS
jgi:hypothetical protein